MTSASFRALPEIDLSGDKLTERLPLGPEGVLHGALNNGMTYYIKRTSKPQQRACIQLAVKVGSVVEEESERGVAHLVEHLAFNATKTYEQHKLVSFLESLGAAFGPDQNAYTSFDETVYQLIVPTDKPEIMDQALHVMAEWAFHIRCAQADVDRERGAVHEEWRLGKDATGRMSEAHFKLLLQGSRYAERLPIGLESIILNVTGETVSAFYKRWYQPDKMAIIAAGDFADVADMEALIRRHLDVVPPHAVPKPVPLPTFDYAPHTTPRFGVYADKELQQATVLLTFKQPGVEEQTPQFYLNHLKQQMFMSIMNKRFFRMSKQENAPFHFALVNSERACRACNLLGISAVCLERKTLTCLRAVLTELARVRQHGVSEREVGIVRKEMLSALESAYLERNQSYADSLAEEYVRHFLTGELVVGEEMEARLGKTMLPHITPAHLSDVADAFRSHCSLVIKIMEHRQNHTEADLRAVLDEVTALEEAGRLDAWVEEECPVQLMTSPPPRGAIVNRQRLSELNAEQWQLSNGMRVIFKQTDFLEDQILVAGTAVGGLSEVPRIGFRSASMAVLIANEIGEFGVKPHLLAELLAGQRVDLALKEGTFSRSFSGDQSPMDLETTCQLVHKLFVNQVKPVESELRGLFQMVKQSITADLRNPLNKYHGQVRAINYGNCYYFEPMSLQDLSKVNIGESCDHFNDQFSNPAAFTVSFVGNVEPSRLQELVELYLASIPPTPHLEVLLPKSLKQLEFEFPTMPVVRDVAVPMVSPITQAQLTWPVELQRKDAMRASVWLTLACAVLETRILQKLRFQYGAIYTASVVPFFGCEAPSREGTVRGDVSIQFSCAPEHGRQLGELALAELSSLQEKGVSEEEVGTALTLEQREHESLQQENAYWLDFIAQSVVSRRFQESNDLDVCYSDRMKARDEVRRKCTPEELQNVFKWLFPYPCSSRYTLITMVPRPPLPLRLYNFFASMLSRKYAPLLVLSAAAACVGVLLFKRQRHSLRS